MLLFITKQELLTHTLTRFNTSHVVIYHHTDLHWQPARIGFNTSHVVIYPVRAGMSITTVVSGVSIHLMLLFIMRMCLKPGLTVAFQYISCCYLSKTSPQKGIKNNSFNTSHVVIYLVVSQLHTVAFSCFNTSRVVIYRVSGAL